MGGGPPCFPQGFTCLVVLWITASYTNTFDYRTFTFFGLAFQLVRLAFIYALSPVLNPVYHNDIRFGLLPVRSPLLRKSMFLSSPPGTKMFQFPGFPSIAYGFSYGYLGITPSGFPHSEIHGSKPACGSPWLFAACHVLHRLLVPRHPPYALSSLIYLRNCSVYPR